jgi:4-hydroxybenzoate polyprenyltransferase
MIDFVRTLRPRQWTKNLLVFAGVLFSQNVTDLDLMIRAAAGFLAFSLLSSCVYVVNDVRDVAVDRIHPKKRKRSIASGRLRPEIALAGTAPLLAVVVAVSLWLGVGFTIVLGVYLGLNLVYTFRFKNVVLIDVFLIATGFVLRAIAGVELLQPVAPDTSISPWLLVCTFFGALFLALAKRRREIANAGESAAQQREVLASYSPDFVDGLLHATAATSLMSYALYTMWPATVEKFGTERLLYTVPIVAYGIFRYLFLVHRSASSEDPSLVLLTDRPMQVCVLSYLAVVLVVLYGPW